jgi:transposase
LPSGSIWPRTFFAVHGVDEAGKAVLVRPSVRRDALLDLVAKLPACVIGMEACSGAHHWARQFQSFGHTVRIIAAKFVAPYRLSGRKGKNDAADAQTICEVKRPHMRFVPIKGVDAQGQLSVHRVRQGFIETRAATISLSELRQLDDRVEAHDRHIEGMAKADDRGTKLMAMPGIGAKTASALLASVGNGHDFKCGRQLADWLGLVPGQYSSGGKQRLGRITKAGDSHLRSLLILAARAVVVAGKNKTDRLSGWAQSVAERRGYWKAVVAVAAKNARMAWAMLSKGEAFKPLT